VEASSNVEDPEQEKLFDVIRHNILAKNQEDEDKFLSYFHSGSPIIQDVEGELTSIMDIGGETWITDIALEEKEEDSAIIYTSQETYFEDESIHNYQQTILYSLQKEDRHWKIDSMAGTEINYIDEYGNFMEDTPGSSEGVTSIDELEGDYAALLKEVDLSSINEELTVDY